MKSVVVLSLVASLALAVSAHAQAPITERTEKVKLQGKKGESLFRPGFQLAEYSGISSVTTTKTRVPGFEKDKARVELKISGPNLGPVLVFCGGGQSRLGLDWITFERDKLQYVCAITGPGSGEEATFALAWARGGSFLKSLQQPQRAGELWFDGMTLQARTEQIGAAPLGGSQVLGYVITHGGAEIGAVDLSRTGLTPTAYLPPKGSKDRDAAAVLALILMFFQDPGRQR